MLKLGKMTDYGTVIMTVLAQQPDAIHTAAGLAQSTHVSAPTVSKLLKLLSHADLVESQRGAHGGYRLARSPEDITIAQIVSALEGPVSLTECAVHDGVCGIEGHCGVRGNWRVINRAISQALENVTLSEMLTPLTSESTIQHFGHLNAARAAGHA